MNINEFGFVRVAAASPKLKVADCDYNVSQIKLVIEEAIQQNVQLLCFPELCITAYTCGDLFFQTALQRKAMSSLIDLEIFMMDNPSLVIIVGLPLVHRDKLYNVAAVISADGIMGFVPKQEIPNYNEYYEKRWFASGKELSDVFVNPDLGAYPISSSMIFETEHAKFGIEICEDLWVPSPPSSSPSMREADIIFNLSASNEVVGKNSYRKSLVKNQSARCTVAYVYASAGVGESSTDLVFAGSNFIAENGVLLTESKRFSLENELTLSDIDVWALRNERIKRDQDSETTSPKAQSVFCETNPITEFRHMLRTFNPYPFIPTKEKRDENLSEVFNIQIHSLAKRLGHIGSKTITLGISGGLDSTLALLIAIKTFDLLEIPRKNIHAITMPGFGTTERTYQNANLLMKSAGVTIKEISIVPAVTQHLKDIGHDINEHTVTFENSQARERTQILMDYANKIGGMVLGTGNLSELALGWTTYNGDHMSMYAVNSGVPKTLVSTLVRWIAHQYADESTKNVLIDILDTPFSPELLPTDKDGKIAQKTESFVGPYELHDFFIYRMLRHGDEPRRIYFIAQQAFEKLYSAEEILKWLKVFYKRFFQQQFKRSCMPDGPKVGSVNLSPRGDWRMPSDAMATLWLEDLEKLS
ncbi:MAG TPA: NAD(+) synthase [Dysgonamonadaceae bacterium]|nr:NAD(+) synthase [Dysgonamonadaceae bacterium]HUI32949.1 NAD(+) synthase [Dysgonamonadaceae bacterium]